MNEPRIIFVGQLRWRSRWREIRKALDVLWAAVRGYHQSIEWDSDSDDVSL